MTRLVLVSLTVAASIVVALVQRQDRRARRELELEERARVRALEFERHIQTALDVVEDPGEIAQLFQQERITELFTAAALAAWDDPAFGAYCEQQFVQRSRARRPE